MDEIGEYVPSPELTVVRQQGDHRLTKHPRHEDYSVWFRGRIVAQGGWVLMETVFNRMGVGSLQLRRD